MPHLNVQPIRFDCVIWYLCQYQKESPKLTVIWKWNWNARNQWFALACAIVIRWTLGRWCGAILNFTRMRKTEQQIKWWMKPPRNYCIGTYCEKRTTILKRLNKNSVLVLCAIPYSVRLVSAVCCVDCCALPCCTKHTVQCYADL